jgi:cytochrome oxidase Cu insertion factor (SCO1/SenC/PrrC family)
VNLFMVVALSGIGLALLTGRARAVRPAVIACAALCLADWVLVQDLGFMGGVGTDPNSMVPIALVVVAGYLAMAKVPAVLDSNVVPITSGQLPRSLRVLVVAEPTYAFRSVAALAAIGVTLLGAVPMTGAWLAPHADPVLAQAIDGAPQPVNAVAAGFGLVDQYGKEVSLASLRGKVVALTFLDDTCTTDCPVIAQEFRDADRDLGHDTRRVEMVAINANPRYITTDYIRAFDRQEGLQGLANWDYLTGTLPQLRQVWKAYGESVLYFPGGAMIGHSEYAWVIDASGHTRDILDTDPGPATSATQASFAVMLDQTVTGLLGRS